MVRTLCSSLVCFIFLVFALPGHAIIIPLAATLDEAQSGGTGSAATGTATLDLDTVLQTFDLDLIVSGIGLGDLLGVGPNTTPVHIHFAPPGSNGPIVYDVGNVAPFVADGPNIRLTINNVPLSSPNLIGPFSGNPSGFQAALLAGDTYLNIHTASFPAGEIRGQLQIPEPVTVLLMGMGLAGLGLARRRLKA